MNIIAYGSLMNQESLERTLQRRAQLNPITVPNVQRIFNAPFGEYAFLNLAKAKGSSIRVAYFIVSDSEAVKFAEREKGSDLIEVLPNYYAFIWPEADCQDLPVLQSYIDVCQAGCQRLGLDLWQGTRIPPTVINDTQNPLYP